MAKKVELFLSIYFFLSILSIYEQNIFGGRFSINMFTQERQINPKVGIRNVIEINPKQLLINKT